MNEIIDIEAVYILGGEMYLQWVRDVTETYYPKMEVTFPVFQDLDPQERGKWISAAKYALAHEGDL